MKAQLNMFAKPSSLHFHTTVLVHGGLIKLAVHGCSLILRPLPPPMWSGNEASRLGSIML